MFFGSDRNSAAASSTPSAELQAQSFVDSLERNGLKYEKVEGAIDPSYMLSFGGGDFVFSRMRIHVRFDDNGRSAHFFTFDIAKVPDGKRAAMLEACNAANKSFRWVSFYIDDDGDVNCDADASLDAAGGGDVCAEIVMRMVDILNKSYGDFMRALWS